MPKAARAMVICLSIACIVALGAILPKLVPLMSPAPSASAVPLGPPGRTGQAGQAARGDDVGGHGLASGLGTGSGERPGPDPELGKGVGAEEDEARDPGSPGVPGIAVEHGRFVGRSAGEKRWEFSADEVRVREDATLVVIEGIRDGVLYDEGEPWLEFSAARGEVDTSTNDLQLKEVRFSSGEGDTLTADTLTWSESDRKVVIRGNVRVEHDRGSSLLCDEAEYYPGENVLEAIGTTTVEIEVPED